MSYSPRIKKELVRKLYLLKHSSVRRIPMTKMVNEAVEEYLDRKIIKEETNETNKRAS